VTLSNRYADFQLFYGIIYFLSLIFYFQTKNGLSLTKLRDSPVFLQFLIFRNNQFRYSRSITGHQREHALIDNLGA
jgi:hypothetical protein